MKGQRTDGARGQMITRLALCFVLMTAMLMTACNTAAPEPTETANSGVRDITLIPRGRTRGQ